MTEPAKPGFMDRLRARFVWLDRVMRAQERYQDSKGDFYAAGITYFTIFALFPLLMVGFAAGGFVLTAVFNAAGASVLAVVVWHAAYNVGAGTDGGGGLVAPVMTACVIFWAVTLVRRHRRSLPAFGNAPPA